MPRQTRKKYLHMPVVYQIFYIEAMSSDFSIILPVCIKGHLTCLYNSKITQRQMCLMFLSLRGMIILFSLLIDQAIKFTFNF